MSAKRKGGIRLVATSICTALAIFACLVLWHTSPTDGGDGTSAPVRDEVVARDETSAAGDSDATATPDETAAPGDEAHGTSAASDAPQGVQASPTPSFAIPEGADYEPEVVLVSVDGGVAVEEVNALLSSTDAIATKEVSGADLSEGLIKLEVAEGSSVEEAVNALAGAAVVENVQPNYYYYAMRGGEEELRAALEEASGPLPPDAEPDGAPAGDGAEATDDDSPVVAEGEQAQDALAGDTPPATAEDAGDDAASALGDAADVEGGGAEALMEALAVSVDDVYASQQWALASMNLYEAWSLSRCEDAVTVAVFDQYPDSTHTDLVDHVSYYDAYGNTEEIEKVDAHGTHVTGIVGATTNNGIGIAGVSYNAHVLAVNVFNDISSASEPRVDTASAVRAYRHIMEHADELGVRVVNLSFGASMASASYPDNELTSYINEAFEDYGIITVAAAGNKNEDAEPYYEYPGDLPHVVSVMNLKKVDTGVVRNGGSNYNVAGQKAKNIAAPGTSIRSTVPTNGYRAQGGTSMASPQVAGVLALEFAANPDLSAQEAVTILYATAVDLGDEGFDEEYGWGMPDAHAAVTAAITGEYDGGVIDDDPDEPEAPAPTAVGATRIPVGATASYVVTNGTIDVKSGEAATLSGTTLTGVAEGSVTLALIDENGKERSTMDVEVYALDGFWTIASALPGSFVLDVAGASVNNGANVCLWNPNGKRNQAWALELQDDGTFLVRSSLAGKVLDVAKGSTDNAANVSQYSSGDKAWQRWHMTVDKDNLVTFLAAHSGKALDVYGGTAKAGSNVIQYQSHDKTNQKWVLERAPVEVGALWDGVYRIASAADSRFVLDVSGASTANGANVLLWQSKGSDNQKWLVRYQGNNTYSVASVKSGKVLDVARGRLGAGVNVVQWSWSGSAWQRWEIVENGDGTHSLLRLGTDYALDAYGGRAYNGCNVNQWTANTSKAQRWILTQY